MNKNIFGNVFDVKFMSKQLNKLKFIINVIKHNVRNEFRIVGIKKILK